MSHWSREVPYFVIRPEVHARSSNQILCYNAGMKSNARIEDPHLSVLSCIRSFVKEHHYAPTIAEICKTTGLRSKGTIAVHLNTLRDLGLVTWQPGQERTIVITDRLWFAYRCLKRFLIRGDYLQTALVPDAIGFAAC